MHECFFEPMFAECKCGRRLTIAELCQRANAIEKLSAEYEKLLLITGVFLDKIRIYAHHKRGCTWDDGTKGDICICGFRPLSKEIFDAQQAYADILEKK